MTVAAELDFVSGKRSPENRRSSAIDGRNAPAECLAIPACWDNTEPSPAPCSTNAIRELRAATVCHQHAPPLQ